jgi:hypothetical protein
MLRQLSKSVFSHLRDIFSALRTGLLLPAAALLFISPPVLFAQSSGDTSRLCRHNCASKKQEIYDLQDQTHTGDTIRGPKTIVAKNLNVLRYKYAANSKVTFSQPPDLFAKLMGIADPQSGQGGAAVPGKTSGATDADKAQMAVASAAKAVKPKVATKGTNQSGYSPVAQAMNDKVQKASDQAELAIEQVNAATGSFDNALHDELTTAMASVKTLVQNANAASDKVAAGGQGLLSFLQTVDASSTYDGIGREFAAQSKFAIALGAQWPASGDITNAKLSGDLRKTRLSSIQTDFSGKEASLLAGLLAAERDLYAAKEAVEQAAVQIANPSKEDQALISADRNLVVNTIDAVANSNQQLKSYENLVNWGGATNSAIETALSNLDVTGTAYAGFEQAQAGLLEWQQQMLKIKNAWDLYSAPGANQELHPNPFTMQIAGNCDYTFSSTKQTVVTLTAVDQLPAKTAAAPTTVLSVTIECASPFNVSAGVAFSTIPNREYAIQPVATPPGSTTTTNQFALTSDSSFHPMVLGMVSARLWEPDEKVAFHVSFGLAGNFNSQSAGGSSAEFLIGPSISLFRTMFITPGLYIGKKTTLADGFTVGSAVPPNITTVPLQSAYKPAFGLAITFTKP